MKAVLLATAAFLAFAAPASADVIITFAQSVGGNTITGTASATGTVWGGADVPISIAFIDAPTATPVAAFLDISAASTTGALNPIGNLILQRFAGTFSINSLADGSGTDFLSGVFNDGAITANGATGIAVFAPEGAFFSDVITTLSSPLSINFALTNATPPVSLFACTATNPGCDTGQTINSFTVSVAGDASATIPEPATLALFGAGLLGLSLMRRRKRG